MPYKYICLIVMPYKTLKGFLKEEKIVWANPRYSVSLNLLHFQTFEPLCDISFLVFLNNSCSSFC